MPTITAMTVACFLQAAAHQGIPAPMFWALYATEGGTAGAASPNRDGSHDLGPMQVNDATWVGRVADLQFGGNRAAARERLLDDGCYNAEVSAWIFRGYMDETRGDLATAVGHYNSHNPDSMAKYEARFSARMIQLYGTQLAGQPGAPEAGGAGPRIDAMLRGSSAPGDSR